MQSAELLLSMMDRSTGGLILQSVKKQRVSDTAQIWEDEDTNKIARKDDYLRTDFSTLCIVHVFALTKIAIRRSKLVGSQN